MKRCYQDRWALACLAILFIAGCSGGAAARPDLKNLVPVSGIVTLDNKPLADATVAFHPKSAASFLGAIATTDASGKYELETDSGNGKMKKGVIPGSYNVTVSKLVKMDGTPAKYDPALGGPMNQGARESVPMKYSTVDEMGLSFIVPEGGGPFDINMEAAGPGEL